MTYNALDNQTSAAALRDQLVLEKQDADSSFDYECATGGKYRPSDEEADAFFQWSNKLQSLIELLTWFSSGSK